MIIHVRDDENCQKSRIKHMGNIDKAFTIIFPIFFFFNVALHLFLPDSHQQAVA